MMEPTARARLNPLDVDRYAAAIGASLHVIYIILGILSIVVLALTLLIPKNIRPEDA
jgi:hypothetical protein